MGSGANDVPLIVVLLAAFSIALAAVVFILFIRGRINGYRIAVAEAAFAKIFRRDGVRLAEVPEHLAELDSRTAELMRAYEQLRTQRQAKRADTVRERRPALLDLLGQLRKEALDEIEKISADDDFVQIDQVLDIRSGLAALGSNLSALESAPDFSQSLLTKLESSDAWNAALTTPNLLEAYFDAMDKLKPLARRLRAIEKVLSAAFLRLDVEILVTQPFSTVERAEAAARNEEIPRDLFSLRAVQEIAARRAHAIASRSPIVVDCFAPGWNSHAGQIGQHMPRFTIYDPSH
jgi:hypothetical protein